MLGSNSGPCGYTMNDGQTGRERENNVYSILYGDKSMRRTGGGKREWVVLEEVSFF